MTVAPESWQSEKLQRLNQKDNIGFMLLAALITMSYLIWLPVNVQICLQVPTNLSGGKGYNKDTSPALPETRVSVCLSQVLGIS